MIISVFQSEDLVKFQEAWTVSMLIYSVEILPSSIILQFSFRDNFLAQFPYLTWHKWNEIQAIPLCTGNINVFTSYLQLLKLLKQHQAHLALLPILLSYQCRKAKQNKAAKWISFNTNFVNNNQASIPKSGLQNHEKELTEKIDILTVLYTSHCTAFGSERNSVLNKSQFLTVVKAAKSYKLSTLQSAAMFTSVSSSNRASHENLVVYRK